MKAYDGFKNIPKKNKKTYGKIEKRQIIRNVDVNMSAKIENVSFRKYIEDCGCTIPAMRHIVSFAELERNFIEFIEKKFGSFPEGSTVDVEFERHNKDGHSCIYNSQNLCKFCGEKKI